MTCPRSPAVIHSLLPEGTYYPLCGLCQSGGSSSAASSAASSSGSSSDSSVTTTVSTPLVQRPHGRNNDAQFHPATASTIETVRQGVSGSGNVARNKSSVKERHAVNLLPSFYKFTVRVAYTKSTSLRNGITMYNWTVFTEGWTVIITNTALTSFDALKDTF